MTFSNRRRLVSAACLYALMREKRRKRLKGVACTRKLWGQVGDGPGTDLELGGMARRGESVWLQLLQRSNLLRTNLRIVQRIRFANGQVNNAPCFCLHKALPALTKPFSDV
jgi:hypothetical protein